MPIKKRTSNMSYKFLVSSKLVNGKVPSIFGGDFGNNSNIVNNSVK